ncbi:MAG: acetylxylan esterase [Verrucomicrobia bacterium]|nr:acetylxylan esterase [Verrucomicrobiota bacterium]
MKTCFCLLVSLSLTCATPAFAADAPTSLQLLLQHPILGTNVPMAEVQAFTETRVPRMPAVKSAAEWQKIADRLRREMFERVVFRGEAAVWRDAKTKVEWLDTIEGGPGYKIRKLRYEALPGLWIPALLYLPDNLSGKVPVMLAVNGHDGNGKAAPYKQIRCINLAKRGMISLNVEWFGMGQLRTPGFTHSRMNQLDLCGTSGVSPFYLAMKRGLDVLLSLENADASRVAVSGVSGGGWQSIFISSLDTRITLSNPVAGYSSFRTRARYLTDLGDSEQTPCDMATVADYTHLTAMRAPRPTLLTYNAKDHCCFAAPHALPPLLDAVQPIYTMFGQTSALRSHINYVPGNHNFERDNREAFYGMVGDFFSGDPKFDAVEIFSESEVKTNTVLAVELPADNADFNTLARALSRNLPRHPEIPTAKAALNRWQQTNRAKLREVVHAKDYAVVAERVGGEEKDGVKATFWKLKLSGVWTVAAVELTRGAARETVILTADEGRKSAAAEVERLLAAGKRVLAVDPFYFGESRIAARDYLFALLVAGVGERPLGLQASQLAAIARWSQRELKTGPVTLTACGPRSSTFSLIAAALEEKAVSGVELRGALGSLKEVIEKDWTVDKTPEMFCFGLLEAFDVPQLTALVAPRKVR